MIADSSYNFAFSTSGKFTSRDAKKKKGKRKKEESVCDILSPLSPSFFFFRLILWRVFVQ